MTRKIRKAYCPPQVVAGNPILNYFRAIVFQVFDSVTIKRKPEHGGDVYVLLAR